MKLTQPVCIQTDLAFDKCPNPVIGFIGNRYRMAPENPPCIRIHDKHRTSRRIQQNRIRRFPTHTLHRQQFIATDFQGSGRQPIDQIAALFHNRSCQRPQIAGLLTVETGRPDSKSQPLLRPCKNIRQPDTFLYFQFVQSTACLSPGSPLHQDGSHRNLIRGIGRPPSQRTEAIKQTAANPFYHFSPFIPFVHPA